MKLQSIRLHPYAGIADKTYSFENGLTVICGPNEEGKSTVAKAIRQVLFLETNLTPARKQNELQHVLPIAGGDTIRITLKFDCDDCSFTLKKQWGPISNTELTASDGIVLTDSRAVQERISEMLPANQAVVEQVMIASQSQLADAVDKLTNTVQASLSDQLRGAVLKGGGISATQLEETINNMVDSYFARWDESLSTISGGASRGLSNPWSKSVGRVATCWYKWQEAIQTEKEIESYETENERLQGELNKCNEELKNVSDYLNEHKAAYDAINKRIAIEGDISKFKIALDNFAQDAERWPIALAERNVADKSLKKTNEELKDLKKELEIARQKADAQRDLDKLAAINEHNNKVEEGERLLKTSREILADDVGIAKKYHEKIAHCQALIDGQKLRLSITPTVNGTLEVTHSGGQRESINFLSGQHTHKDIRGGITFDWKGVSFTIQSANEDIGQLEKSMQEATVKLVALLKAYEQSSFESLEIAAEQYKNTIRHIQQAKGNLKAALGNDTLEGLKDRCEKVTALPSTRDINVLEEKWQSANNLAGQHQTIFDGLKEEIDNLEKKHESLANLDDRRINGKQALREKESELNTLPLLPQGYESAVSFQSAYTEVLQRQTNQNERKHSLELEKQALREPALSLSDAKDQVLLTQRSLDTALAEGKAYRRIQKVLGEILASADSNAFKPLHQKTEKYLERLSSGRFKHIPFDITQPQKLEGDGVALPVWLLSKGTKDILALSLRLAAAEVYLDNNSGFVIMDDPLVDMDNRRRKASAVLLNQFSEKFQTIVFTCHEEHENLLKAPEVEKADATV